MRILIMALVILQQECYQVLEDNLKFMVLEVPPTLTKLVQYRILY